MYFYDDHIGIVGLDQSCEKVWQSEIDIGGESVIDQNGILYVASDSVLVAFNSDGSVKWTYNAPDAIREPALDLNTIYLCCENRTIIALGKDGRLQCTYYIGSRIDRSPAVDSDGTLYFGTRNGMFYAMRYNGSMKWQKQLKTPIDSTPIIAADDRIFVADGETIYAFNPDGSIHWQFPIAPEASGYRSS